MSYSTGFMNAVNHFYGAYPDKVISPYSLDVKIGNNAGQDYYQVLGLGAKDPGLREAAQKAFVNNSLIDYSKFKNITAPELLPEQFSGISNPVRGVSGQTIVENVFGALLPFLQNTISPAGYTRGLDAWTRSGILPWSLTSEKDSAYRYNPNKFILNGYFTKYGGSESEKQQFLDFTAPYKVGFDLNQWYVDRGLENKGLGEYLYRRDQTSKGIGASPYMYDTRGDGKSMSLYNALGYLAQAVQTNEQTASSPYNYSAARIAWHQGAQNIDWRWENESPKSRTAETLRLQNDTQANKMRSLGPVSASATPYLSSANSLSAMSVLADDDQLGSNSLLG